MSDLIGYMGGIYGEMTKQSEKRLTYLGMDLNFEKPGEVSISIESYINKILEEFPEPITEDAATCTGTHLFTVNKNGKKISDERDILFHRFVAKLLFISKRERPGIQSTVDF